MNTIRNFGLILPKKIETREEGAEHILGAAGLPEPVILPDGNWLPYLPDREPQSKGFDTYSCTVYAILSAIEEAVFKATGVRVNYADRYVANVAKNRGILTVGLGADPHRMLELIRTITGQLSEEKCPWTDDINTPDKYFGITGQELANLMFDGYKWYDEWVLNHKWVFTFGTPQEKRVKLQDALTKGSVVVSVVAWIFDSVKGYYIKPAGSTDGHLTGLVRVEGDLPYDIFDSYDTYLKKLDPLFDFSIAKVIFLTRKQHLFLKNMYFQMMDEEVKHLQKALVQLGYPIPNGITDLYGVETRSAVHAFQRDSGIEGNFGQNFGPLTRYKMNLALNPTAPFGGSFATWLAALFSGV